MTPKVYLETSFVSYLTGKLSLDLITLQRQITSQRWWTDERQRFELFVSQRMYKECHQGDPEAARERSVILQNIPLLPINGRQQRLFNAMATDQQPYALPKNLWDTAYKPDKIMEDLYAYRAEYAASFNYDLQKMLADLKAEETQNPAPRATIQPLEPSASIKK